MHYVLITNDYDKHNYRYERAYPCKNRLRNSVYLNDLIR